MYISLQATCTIFSPTTWDEKIRNIFYFTVHVVEKDVPIISATFATRPRIRSEHSTFIFPIHVLSVSLSKVGKYHTTLHNYIYFILFFRLSDNSSFMYHRVCAFLNTYKFFSIEHNIMQPLLLQ